MTYRELRELLAVMPADQLDHEAVAYWNSPDREMAFVVVAVQLADAVLPPGSKARQGLGVRHPLLIGRPQ